MRVEISLSFYSISNVVVGREDRDQSLDGGGNTLHNVYVYDIYEAQISGLRFFVHLISMNEDDLSSCTKYALTHSFELHLRANF